MILEQTHANRWIVRERRTSGAIARITHLHHDARRPYFRTEMLDPLDPSEHVLLRDADTLELAFALAIARSTRPTPEIADEPEDDAA